MNTQQIHALKPKEGKQYSVSGFGVNGLSLTVSYGGAKVFYFRYRNDKGKQQRLKIGAFPAISLARAKSIALSNAADVSEGKDPLTQKKQDKLREKQRPIKTVEDLWLHYLETTGFRKKSIDNEKWLWKKYLHPYFGSLDVEQYDRRAMVPFLTDLRVNKSPHMANRCQSLITRLATHGIEQMVFDTNPAHHLGRKPKEKPRDRVLNEAELRQFWRTLHNPDVLQKIKMSISMAQAIKLTTLTLCRRAEIIESKWSEIDLSKQEFILPGERVKNGRTHVVPLSKQAIETLELAKANAMKKDSSYIFPSQRGDTHFLPSALTRACARLCNHLQFEKFRTHDLRRTGVTTLAGSPFKVSRHILTNIINHKSDMAGASAMFRAYDHNDYADEKREALDVWGAYLNSLLEEKNQ